MSSPLAVVFPSLPSPATARGLARVPPHGYVGKPQGAEEERKSRGPKRNVGAHAASLTQHPFVQSSGSYPASCGVTPKAAHVSRIMR